MTERENFFPFIAAVTYGRYNGRKSGRKPCGRTLHLTEEQTTRPGKYTDKWLRETAYLALLMSASPNFHVARARNII